MSRRGLAALLACVVWTLAPSADRERDLDALRRAIEAGRARVETFERQQRGLLEALEGLDQAVVALERDVAVRRAEAREATAALRAVEAELPGLEERLGRTRAAMAARALALYKTGQFGPVQVLFAATDLRQLLARLDELRLLLANDRRLLARFDAERAALDAARAQAAAASERREQAARRLEQRLASLDDERGTKRALLDSVRRDRARERAALVELEAAARALEETLARLGDAPEALPVPTGAAFEVLRGRLPAPVDAPVVRSFGRVVDAEFHTQVFRNGVDFGAGAGAPVRAVAPGRVRFAGWFRGYGRIVILDHGGSYFTVSGHLDRIDVEVGQAVDERDPIGTVGESGSLSGPRLYFEIRAGSEAVDPAAWLRP